MPRPHLLILSFSDLSRDPRVRRQMRAFREDYQITAAGVKSPALEGIDFVPLRVPEKKAFGRRLQKLWSLKVGPPENLYWSEREHQEAYDRLKSLKIDLILANDLSALPLAVRLKQLSHAPILFDAHEYSPLELEGQWKFKVLHQSWIIRLLKSCLPFVDAMTTVNSSLAGEYSQQFGLEVKVVWNTPAYRELSPQHLGSSIRMVHHGAAMRNRKLENMILLLKYIPPHFNLTFLLMNSDPAYLEKLRKIAEPFDDRVQFAESVPSDELSRALNAYDLGLYLLAPQSFNDRFALPNKIFEFVQGRLALAVWPSPEMAHMVRRFECGVVASKFSLKSMADEIAQLTSESIFRMKQKSHEAASEVCAEKTDEVWVKLAQHILFKERSPTKRVVSC